MKPLLSIRKPRIMGRTYKDRYDSNLKRVAVSKRQAKKLEIREATKKNNGKKDSYNNLELDYYEEDNFEKFNRKR